MHRDGAATARFEREREVEGRRELRAERGLEREVRRARLRSQRERGAPAERRTVRLEREILEDERGSDREACARLAEVMEPTVEEKTKLARGGTAMRRRIRCAMEET